MGTMVPISPSTERQARPLASLPASVQAEAWQRAVDTAPYGKVTARHVESVVAEYKPTSREYPLAAANHAISADPDYDGDEWYTPKDYIEAARTVMGEITVDPASTQEAQEIIRAKVFYTKEDDSLRDGCAWNGCVWLNPPYSTPLINRFVTKLINEYDAGNVTQAIILTNNSSDTKWFHDLLSQFPACFTRGRVQFWRPDNSTFGARQGQTLFYLGDNISSFVSIFSSVGKVVATIDNQ